MILSHPEAHRHSYLALHRLVLSLDPVLRTTLCHSISMATACLLVCRWSEAIPLRPAFRSHYYFTWSCEGAFPTPNESPWTWIAYDQTDEMSGADVSGSLATERSRIFLTTVRNVVVSLVVDFPWDVSLERPLCSVSQDGILAAPSGWPSCMSFFPNWRPLVSNRGVPRAFLFSLLSFL